MARSHLRHVVTDRSGNVIQNAAVEVQAVSQVSIDADPVLPSAVPSLHTWFDFSDTATLFTDTGRTTAVSVDGQLVKGISDKSGLGHHASEASNPPVYKTGIRNSLSVGRFAGAERLTTANFAGLSQPITMMAVIKNTNDHSWAMSCSALLATPNTNMSLSQAIGPNLGDEFASGGITLVTSGPTFIVGPSDTDNNFHIQTALFDTSSSAIWRDNVLETADTLAADTLTGLILGGPPADHPEFAIQHVVGDFCEALVFSGELTTIQREGVTAYLANKWGFLSTSDPAVVGDMFEGSSGETTLSNPLVSNDQGVVEAWLEYPQPVNLVVSDNTDTAFYPSHSTLLSFDEFTVESETDLPASPAKILYVHPDGNDSNDGRSWQSAKQYIMSAYDSLTGASGRIYIANGAQAQSNPDYGIWIYGSFGGNTIAETPPAGWYSQKAVEFIGASPGPSSGHGGPTATINAGSATDVTQPAIWLAGVAAAVRFENLAFQTTARWMNIGINPLDDNRATAACSGITFENIRVTASSEAGSGPTIDSGYAFWIYFKKCILSANDPGYTISAASITGGTTAEFTTTEEHGLQVGETFIVYGVTPADYNSGEIDMSGQYGGTRWTATAVTSTTVSADIGASPAAGTVFGSLRLVDADKRAIALLSGSSAELSPGLWFFKDCVFNQGGVRHYLRPGDVTLDNVVLEGDFSFPVPRLYNGLDAGNDAGNVLVMQGHQADSFAADPYMVGLTPVAGADGPLPGTFLNLGGAPSFGPKWFSTAAADPSQDQTGFSMNRVIARQDTSRRQFAPAAARFTNLASHDTSSWTTTGTLTTGIAAPDGSTNAARLTSAAGDNSASVSLGSRVTSAGDTYIGGAWIRAYTTEGLIEGTIEQEFTANTPPTFPGGAHVITWGTTYTGIILGGIGQEWTWVTWSGTATASGVGANNVVVNFHADPDTPLEIFAPTVVYIPTGTLTAGELVEFERHLVAYPETTVVGNLGFLRDNNLHLPKNYMDIGVITAPAAPASNFGRLYVDTSGGKDRLVVRFASGAAQVIATEP